MKVAELLNEDIFAKGDELMAAVNDDTSRKASTPTSISTNRAPLGRQTGTTRGLPVYYAFSYKTAPSATDLLSSFKGKGPFKFPPARRDKFMDAAASHVAQEMRKMNLQPDVIATPESTSPLAADFANLVADKLGVKARSINAFKKLKNTIDLDGPRDEVRAAIVSKHIYMDHFNEKFTGDEKKRQTALRDLITQIIRIIRKHGYLAAKEVNKPMLKFVKNIVTPNVDPQSLAGKDVMVIDDILSSGGTMSDIFRAAKELGAKSVFGCTLFARTS